MPTPLVDDFNGNLGDTLLSRISSGGIVWTNQSQIHGGSPTIDAILNGYGSLIRPSNNGDYGGNRWVTQDIPRVDGLDKTVEVELRPYGPTNLSEGFRLWSYYHDAAGASDQRGIYLEWIDEVLGLYYVDNNDVEVIPLTSKSLPLLTAFNSKLSLRIIHGAVNTFTVLVYYNAALILTYLVPGTYTPINPAVNRYGLELLPNLNANNGGGIRFNTFSIYDGKPRAQTNGRVHLRFSHVGRR